MTLSLATYTYSFYDADPTQTEGNVWPHFNGREVQATGLDHAVDLVAERLETEAAQLGAPDYSPGDAVWALIRGPEGVAKVSAEVPSAEDEEDEDEEDEEDEPVKADADGWETVYTFVATFPDDDGDGACDVEVQVGETACGRWFVRTRDEGGGPDDAPDTVFKTREDAEEFARVFASEHDEGDGQNAEDYLRAALEDAAGEPVPCGEYAVYWETALDDEGPRARYATEAAASAAVELANADLAARHPGGNLLCGFSVRRLVDGEWLAVGDDW